MPQITNTEVHGLKRAIYTAKYPKSVDIMSLTDNLTKGIKACANCNTGEGHDNFLKGIIVQFDLTFSNKAWVELQRYHFIDFVSSQSTMHKITKFDIKKQCNRYVDPRIIDIVQNKINEYNRLSALNLKSEASKERREILNELYLEILYNVPSGFELTAGMTTNYQQLKTIYQQRRYHKLPDWKMFCDWCETLPLFKELCIDRNNKEEN